jgi:hypothetical protein
VHSRKCVMKLYANSEHSVSQILAFCMKFRHTSCMNPDEGDEMTTYRSFTADAMVAEVHNESTGTGNAPYFIYYRSRYQTASGGLRFNRRASADRVANEINRALALEGRLLKSEEDQA